MSDDPTYLTVQEAAAYLGVSAQTLRRWDAASKLRPVRHPVSGYRFYRRADLEPFRLEYQRAEVGSETASKFFLTTPVHIANNERLREPQREAHQAVLDHFKNKTDAVILQIPVGCGKTGIIAIAPFQLSEGRVLVIAPNVTIRQVISEALDVANPRCFWRRTQVISNFSGGPYTAVLDGPDANLHDCSESHFVVTNIQQLASSADRWLPQFPPNFFAMIIVDEGHHNVAPSWRKVFERFPDAKVVSLTATPFRGDQQVLKGDVLYRYSYARAMMKGYIKQIHSVNVAPSEISFTFKGDQRRHTLDEVLALREEQWFRRGVALAPECNSHIVDASIAHCLRLRQSGTHHQIIAAACSVDHARQVRSLFEERGMAAREIYSEMPAEEQYDVISSLRKGRLDCVVQVQMLGEGFDHPPLSVAAVFRPFRTLSPYVQFVGRVMRVVREDDTGHPDNHGFVVSHVGLNNEEQWEEFRELDLDDQHLLHQWLTDQNAVDDSVGGGPRRFDVGMQVQDEIVSHFIGHSFLDPDDDRVLDKLLAQKIPGTGLLLSSLIDREALRDKLRSQRVAAGAEARSIPVSPQRRRRALRTRLPERTASVGNRVLSDLGLHPIGREIGFAFPRNGGRPNRMVVSQLLNRRINEHLGISPKQRATLSAEQLETVIHELDRLGDEVRNEIEAAIRNKKRP